MAKIFKCVRKPTENRLRLTTWNKLPQDLRSTDTITVKLQYGDYPFRIFPLPVANPTSCLQQKLLRLFIRFNTFNTNQPGLLEADETHATRVKNIKIKIDG